MRCGSGGGGNLRPYQGSMQSREGRRNVVQILQVVTVEDNTSRYMVLVILQEGEAYPWFQKMLCRHP